MKKTLRPHYLMILQGAIKFTIAVALFFFAIFLLTPSDRTSAIFLLRLYVIVMIIYYAYLFYFWHGIFITLDDRAIHFDTKVGRANHVRLGFDKIKGVELRQEGLEDRLGLKRVMLTLPEHNAFGSGHMILNQYLIFPAEKAEELCAYIEERIKFFEDEDAKREQFFEESAAKRRRKYTLEEVAHEAAEKARQQEAEKQARMSGQAPEEESKPNSMS